MDDGKDLNDIDRALAEALDVDVSPDFLARVRQRIASEPVRTPFWSGWRIAVPAGLAAVAGAAAIALFSTSAPPAPPRLAARSLASLPAAPAVADTRRVPLAVEAVVPAGPARAASAPVRQEPEVLVPREEIEQYRRLLVTAQNLPRAFVVEAPKDIASVPHISDIAIDPIKIDLIIPPKSGEGDRQ
jgi:hypothetical protein